MLLFLVCGSHVGIKQKFSVAFLRCGMLKPRKWLIREAMMIDRHYYYFNFREIHFHILRVTAHHNADGLSVASNRG